MALIGFIVPSCDKTPPLAGKSQPIKQSNESQQPAGSLQSAPLIFIPAVGSRVELQGTATIGAWKSVSTEIIGKIVLDTDAAAVNALFGWVETANNSAPRKLPAFSVRSPPIGEIFVAVMSLHGHSSGMDRDMHNALKATQYSSIEYVFEQLQVATLQWDPQSHQEELKLRIVGKLIMAGVGRSIPMDLIVKRDSRGHFLAHAQTALFMTDFRVTPPAALFGLIKASDQVQVFFDLDFVLKNRSSGH